MAITALAVLSAAPAAQELRVAIWAAPPTLGNPFGTVGPPSALAWGALFDQLVSPTETGNLDPALAERWESITPLRWRFYLRRGVEFSNGEPFDAAAVAATINWLISPDGARSMVGVEISSVEGVDIVDDFTIDIRTRIPDAILPKRLTPVSIVAPRAWAERGVDGFTQQPVGTGPYRLETWGDGGRIEMAAAPASWRKPKHDRLTLLVTSDNNARVQSLMSRQVDIALGLSPESTTELKAMGYSVFTAPTPQVFALAFNVVGKPDSIIADQRVRTALNVAVDKTTITNVMMGGWMHPASQGATPMTFGYDPGLAPYPFDPEKARALLTAAGVKPGARLTAEVVANGMPGGSEFLGLLQQDFARVGVTLDIRAVPFADWLRKYVSNSFDVELFGASWQGGPYNDSVRPATYFSCAKPQPFFCDPDIMPLLDMAAAEFDVDARRGILHRMARRMHETAPSLLLYEVTDLAVTSDRVANFRFRARVPVYEDIVLKGE